MARAEACENDQSVQNSVRCVSGRAGGRVRVRIRVRVGIRKLSLFDQDEAAMSEGRGRWRNRERAREGGHPMREKSWCPEHGRHEGDSGY